MSFGGSTGFDELRLERSESEEEHDGGLMTHPEAQAAAEARYREVAITRYKLTLKIVGDAQIPAKCVVAVHGIANTVDGVYYVQAVESEIAPGKFTTTLHLQRDSQRVVATHAAEDVSGARNPSVDAGPSAVDTHQLQRQLAATVGPDGSVVPCNIFVASGAGVASSRVTWSDLADGNLTAAERQQFENYTRQTVLPDR